MARILAPESKFVLRHRIRRGSPFRGWNTETLRKELLKTEYHTSEEAATKLPQAIIDLYKQSYPKIFATREQDVRQAGQAILTIYNRNVFPDLKVTWGTYPNNLGHMDFPGCFRCHDGGHSTAGGEAITQECTTCHETLAADEASPEILKTLGISGRITKMQKQ